MYLQPIPLSQKSKNKFRAIGYSVFTMLTAVLILILFILARREALTMAH
jgi:hypothetical protein